ncbi:MAG TPA: hypothetical protein DCS10_06445, partial [Oscillibacter sp.]|nr:hypothetical protein [Oscillibacter sp.]
EPLKAASALVRVIINKRDARKDGVDRPPHLTLCRRKAIDGALFIAVQHGGVFAVQSGLRVWQGDRGSFLKTKKG